MMVETKKCDVYSFGVVTLDTMIGKHPGELITSLSSPSCEDIMDSHLSLSEDLQVAKDVVYMIFFGSQMHPSKSTIFFQQCNRYSINFLTMYQFLGHLIMPFPYVN